MSRGKNMQIINLSNNDLESIASRSDYKKGSFGTVVQVPIFDTFQQFYQFWLEFI